MVIIVIVLIAVLAILGIYSYRRKLNQERSKISFKESLDLAELPIVTFLCGKVKLNFLLDTGSNDSHIASKFTKLLRNCEKSKTKINVAGYNGVNVVEEDVYEADLRYKNKTYKANLIASPGLNESFANIKKECGIQIHGILGTKFFEKYKYVLDFAELVAYNK